MKANLAGHFPGVFSTYRASPKASRPVQRHPRCPECRQRPLSTRSRPWFFRKRRFALGCGANPYQAIISLQSLILCASSAVRAAGLLLYVFSQEQAGSAGQPFLCWSQAPMFPMKDLDTLGFETSRGKRQRPRQDWRKFPLDMHSLDRADLLVRSCWLQPRCLRSQGCAVLCSTVLNCANLLVMRWPHPRQRCPPSR